MSENKNGIKTTKSVVSNSSIRSDLTNECIVNKYSWKKKNTENWRKISNHCKVNTKMNWKSKHSMKSHIKN